MTDPASQLATLRALRATITDPAHRAALDQVIAALESAPLAQHRQAIGGHAQVGVAVAGNIQGNLYLDGRRADAAARLLADYLARLRGRCASMPLEGMRQQQQVGDVLAISLDQVFTQLTVEGTVKREEFRGQVLQAINFELFVAEHTAADVLPWQRRIHLWRPLTRDERQQKRADVAKLISPDIPFTADQIRLPDSYGYRLDALDIKDFKKKLSKLEWLVFSGPRLVTDAITDNVRLVLLGEPGSGKSTVLRYLALTLAEAGLDDSIDLAARLAGWERLSEQRLLPIFLPLLPFARRLAAERPQIAGADDLWRYIADQLEPGDVHTGLAEAVHSELSAGHVLLLLDGLDEVTTAEARQQIVGTVAQFAREYTQCRMVVTCRVRAYEGEQNRAWQLPDWATTTLEEWDHTQMHHFVAAWYAAAVQAGGLPEAQRDARAQALQRAIAASGDLQRLATRPLLLTIMALVHLNDGRLPEDRVTLYSRCVDILLGQWELRGKQYSDYGALMDYLGLPDRDVQRLRPLLTRAAFKAHAAGTADSPGVLGRETLRMMTADHLEQLGHPDPHRGAQKFLEYTDQRAGLIQATDAADAYAFPHLTFQEYLAGLELASGIGVLKRIMEHRADDRWRVPIMLGVGEYVSSNKLELPYQLLRELLDVEDRDPASQARDLIFAAELAADVGWDRLEQGSATFKRLRRDLAVAMASVVEGTALPAAERVRAGVLLGQLGDLRRGVCELLPAMVEIAGGSFVIGNMQSEYRAIIDSEEQEQKQLAEVYYQNSVNDQLITVARFAIARYPVTNAQYAQFMADDGYDADKPWWDADGCAWLHDAHVTAPRFWDDERFGQSRVNYPVVGVSWYEANAFCIWLTQYLDDAYIYRLPSEAEWGYAARGTRRRTYPWGDEAPDAERANYEYQHESTTAVGCFPRGATPDEVYDLAGNVWEWMRSEYRPYPYDPNDGREALDDPNNKLFTLHGGSWNDQSINLRTSFRHYDSPGFHRSNVGFRVARHQKI